MMFSSNQVLQVSGCLDHRGELYNALDFALRTSGHLESFTREEKPAKCVYQITEDGRYCIGWAFDGIEEGWKEYPFDFSVDIISQIIALHLDKQVIKSGMWDGSYRKGFLMKGVEEFLDEEDCGIQNLFCGIVTFEPYTCFYSK